MVAVNPYEKITRWKLQQTERCQKWMFGRQCHHYRSAGKRYCAIHDRGVR